MSLFGKKNKEKENSKDINQNAVNSFQQMQDNTNQNPNLE